MIGVLHSKPGRSGFGPVGSGGGTMMHRGAQSCRALWHCTYCVHPVVVHPECECSGRIRRKKSRPSTAAPHGTVGRKTRDIAHLSGSTRCPLESRQSVRTKWSWSMCVLGLIYKPSLPLTSWPGLPQFSCYISFFCMSLGSMYTYRVYPGVTASAHWRW